MNCKVNFPFNNILSPADQAFYGIEWPMTSELMMEAAMCMWEAIISQETWNCEKWESYQNAVGAVEARHAVMSLAPALSIGWNVHMRTSHDDLLCPFDWNFTPWFLSECVEFETGMNQRINLKTDWLDRCKAVRHSSINALL